MKSRKRRFKPGDTLRYRVTAEGGLLDTAPANEAHDPFAVSSVAGVLMISSNQ